MNASAKAPLLEIRMTPDKGRGLFAVEPIARGALLVEMKGTQIPLDDLPDHGLAMQVGHDLWLHSDGDTLDDCGNHSCVPNAGFTTGEPILYALRDIAPGEEIAWDYSTSIACADWSLTCRCGTPQCRGVILPWHELAPADRERLRPIALAYLRGEGTGEP
jgi:SET domain-containing protein